MALHGTSLFHFLVVEQRGLFLFIFASISFLTKFNTIFVLTYYENHDQRCYDFWDMICKMKGMSSPVSYSSDVNAELTGAPYEWCRGEGLTDPECDAWIESDSLNVSERHKNSIPGAFTLIDDWADQMLLYPRFWIWKVLPKGKTGLFLNMLWPINLFILGYALVFLGTNLFRFFRSAELNHHDFRSGGYMSFTWNLESSRSYKYLARGLMGITMVIPFLLLCYIQVVLVTDFFAKPYSSELNLWEELKKSGSILWGVKYEVIAMVMGVVPMVIVPQGHAFSHHKVWFKDREFHRTWKHLVLETNDYFAVRIADALVHYRRGKKAPLRKISTSNEEADDFFSKAFDKLSDGDLDSESEKSEATGDDDMNADDDTEQTEHLMAGGLE